MLLKCLREYILCDFFQTFSSSKSHNTVAV